VLGGLAAVAGGAQKEVHGRLLQAVERLPEAFRAVVRLRDVDGLTYAGTALLSGRSLTAVKCSVHRGRIALRKVLALDGDLRTAQ
jgi:RNA polymerase sigma-70 factor, ECF subfamily